MRVRFFEVGPNAVGVILRCDQFPLTLGIEEQTGRLTPRTDHALCTIADAGGQLLFEGLDEQHPVLINGAPLAAGPLQPGDQLSVEGHRYVVSYEQTGIAPATETRYRLNPP